MQHEIGKPDRRRQIVQQGVCVVASLQIDCRRLHSLRLCDDITHLLCNEAVADNRGMQVIESEQAASEPAKSAERGDIHGVVIE
jgi:hypothetical protein